MTTNIKLLRDELGVPSSGPIDFRSVLGCSLSEALDRFRNGHVPVPKQTVHNISFDEPGIVPAGQGRAVIDTAYQASHGVEFQPWVHTYDWATQVSGFEPAPGRWAGDEHPVWFDPHVYAVTDATLPVYQYSLSPPNTINTGDEAYGGPTQLVTNDKAMRISFAKPACAVRIDTDYRITQNDQGKPIWNWPQMLAFDAAGTLLDQAEAPHGGPLSVSSWADDIAYVMITVNNHFSGVEPYGIFDNLGWTTIEFVLLGLKKRREAPAPVPRHALVDQVSHRLDEVALAQRRLQKHLAKVADAELAAELKTELRALIKQTESLSAFYRKITGGTVNRTSAVVEDIASPS